jgi:hypothetical protein
MNIAIFGDSWSYHSFKKLENFKETPGTLNFQNMFANIGIRATNYSVKASSNQEILNKLLQTNLNDFDTVIVFQTDPLRNIVDRKKFVVKKSFSTSTGIVNIAENILSEFYQTLSKIEVPLLLVGGLSCIAHQLVPDNIKKIEKSWTELTHHGFKDCYFEWTELAELVHDYLKCTDNLEIVQQQIQSKNYIWQTSDCFGWCHPSDKGYEIMFQELVKHLEKGKV